MDGTFIDLSASSLIYRKRYASYMHHPADNTHVYVPASRLDGTEVEDASGLGGRAKSYILPKRNFSSGASLIDASTASSKAPTFECDERALGEPEEPLPETRGRWKPCGVHVRFPERWRRGVSFLRRWSDERPRCPWLRYTAGRTASSALCGEQ